MGLAPLLGAAFVGALRTCLDLVNFARLVCVHAKSLNKVPMDKHCAGSTILNTNHGGLP